MPRNPLQIPPKSPTYSRLQDADGAADALTQPLAPSTSDPATDVSKLRRVPDSLPIWVWVITVVETCERFAYFGIAGPLQNYVQNGGDDPLRPGGLGLGQANASRINQSFMLWCYLTPIVGAVVADQYLGRVATIVYSSVAYALGLALLALSSLFVGGAYPLAAGGLALAMLFIGIGTGGIKANVGSLLAEQYTGTREVVTTTEEGEKIVVDPKVTIQRIFMTFYVFLNLGSMSGLLTTPIEQRYGFGAAFAIPLVVFLLGFAILLATKRHYMTQTPRGSAIPNAFRVLGLAIRHGCHLDAAKPSYQAAHGGNAKVSSSSSPAMGWDDGFVDEVGRALRACRVFAFLPFWFVCYIQMHTNFVSQAATMETHGVPNDIMINIDPIVVVVCTPVLDRVAYPLLRKLGVTFWPITRIAVAFGILSAAMAYAAVLQHVIYTSPPCFDHPRSRDCAGGTLPNRVHVALQAPAYALVALSEIFAITTGYEYAFTQAPASMRSFVPALFLSTAAVGNVLGIAITPLTVDPKLIWMYAGLAAQSCVVGVVFYLLLRRYNRVEAELAVRGTAEGEEEEGEEEEHGVADATLATAEEEEQQAFLHAPLGGEGGLRMGV